MIYDFRRRKPELAASKRPAAPRNIPPASESAPRRSGFAPSRSRAARVPDGMVYLVSSRALPPDGAASPSAEPAPQPASGPAAAPNPPPASPDGGAEAAAAVPTTRRIFL